MQLSKIGGNGSLFATREADSIAFVPRWSILPFFDDRLMIVLVC